MTVRLVKIYRRCFTWTDFLIRICMNLFNTEFTRRNCTEVARRKTSVYPPCGTPWHLRGENFLGVLTTMLLCVASLQAQNPLNVVLILADDQGAHLSAMGTPGISTPHVDALAREGVLFTNAFASVPSCSPSRSSINTGMYPHANGHWRNTITPKLTAPDSDFGRGGSRVDQVGIHEYITTLPEILRQAGYFTGITQKFHMSPPWKFPYTARDPVSNDPDRYREVITDWIAEAGDRPFFIQANVSPPHRPFRVHLDGHAGYLPDTNGLEVPADLPDTPMLMDDLQQYFACVQLADACAGAIIEALRASGKLENTLIIYTGDQGQAYQRAKATAYYAGLHVPLVISGPGVVGHYVRPDTSDVSAAVSSDLVSLIDLMPTILDYLDLPIPRTVQGQSLWDILGGSTQADHPRTYVYGEHNSHGPARREHYPTRMVFDGRYYYLRNLMHGKNHEVPADMREEEPWGNRAYRATVEAAETHPLPYRLLRMLESGRPAEELYDILTDPACTVNLAGQPGYGAITQRLSDELTLWRVETGDTYDDPLDIPTRRSSK